MVFILYFLWHCGKIKITISINLLGKSLLLIIMVLSDYFTTQTHTLR